MGVCVSSAYEQKQCGRIADTSGKAKRCAGVQKNRMGNAASEVVKGRFESRIDEGMEFIGEWRGVIVELDDSVDDIAPGNILSSITTVIPEPVFLLSDLIDMSIPNRKNTLRNSTEMMARYEKDGEIEHALKMMFKDEYKDDGFFNEKRGL